MKWLRINTIDEFARSLLFLLCCISILISVIELVRKRHKGYMYLIPLFFILILVQLLISEFEIYQGITSGGKSTATNISLAIYLNIEQAVLLILMAISSNSQTLKSFARGAIPFFILTNILCWIYIPLWSTYFSTTSTLEALLMIFASLYYYYEILKKPPTLNLINEPSFWIVTGIFFLFVCITPINLAIESTFVVDYLKSVDSIAYMLIILLFLKATTCRHQVKTL